MAKPQRPKDPNDTTLGERPTSPGRKRPSERGVGLENSRQPPDPDHSPTSKTPL